MLIGGYWEDQTVNVLKLEDHSATLVISRKRLPPQQSVQEYVEAELHRWELTRPEFEILARVPVPYPTQQQCEAIVSRWRPPMEKVVDEVSCWVAMPAHRLLVFSATHLAPMPELVHLAFIQMMSGFRPRPDVLLPQN